MEPPAGVSDAVNLLVRYRQILTILLHMEATHDDIDDLAHRSIQDPAIAQDLRTETQRLGQQIQETVGATNTLLDDVVPRVVNENPAPQSSAARPSQHGGMLNGTMQPGGTLSGATQPGEEEG